MPSIAIYHMRLRQIELPKKPVLKAHWKAKDYEYRQSSRIFMAGVNVISVLYQVGVAVAFSQQKYDRPASLWSRNFKKFY